MASENHYLKKELYELIQNDRRIFEFLLRSSLDGIWYWDLENSEHEWMSPQFWELLGYEASSKKHLASEWQNLIFPKDLEKALDNFNRHCADENHPYDQVVRYRHRDGSPVWVRCRGIAIRDETGKPIRMLGAHNDITDLKQTENELKEREDQFRQLVEDTDNLITRVDEQGNFLYVSSSCLQYYGLTPEECLGRPAFDFIHPDDREMTIKAFAAWLEKGGPRFSHVNRQVHADGRVFFMQWSISLIKDGQGNIKWINSIARDITAEKTARDALSRNESLLQEIGAIARVGGWELDLLTNEIFWTSQVYSLHEVPDDFELDVETAKEFYLPESRKILERAIATTLKTGTPYDLELQLTTAKGRHLWVRTQGRADYENQKPVRLIGSIQDISEHKRAQRDLQCQKDMFHNIFETAPYIMMIINENGRVENINRHGIEFSCHERENTLGMLGGEVFNCQNSFNKLGCGKNENCKECQVRSRVMQTFETGEPVSDDEVSLTVSRNGGQKAKVHFLMNTARILIDDADYVLATFADITERRQAQTALEEARDSLEQMVGERTRELYQSNLELEKEIIERTRSQKALAESEQQIRLLLNSTVEAIYGLDMEGRCTFINQSCLRLLGYADPSELIGRNMHEVIHHTKPDGGFYPKKECPIHQALDNGQILHIEEESLWRKDGSAFPVSCRSHPVYQGGVLAGAVVTFLDITDQQQIKQEKTELAERLRQAQKMEAIGTLAGGIAHDFNNILSVIIGFSELMEVFESPESSQNKIYLEHVLAAAERAKDLVGQILTFSRQADVKRQPLMLTPVVKETLKFLRASLPSTIEIKQNIEDTSIMIMADPTHMHQVIMNLSTNAAHAMGEKGGCLEVSVAAEYLDEEAAARYPELNAGAYARLSVSDTGKGIPQDIKNRIFEPYFTTKETGEGTGLGLAVIHGIIQQYQGSITLESEIGRGSTFHILLPMEADAEVKENEKKEIYNRSGKGRILMVDDEGPLLQVGKETLNHLGYEVEIETDSRKALEMFGKYPDAWDLIITDQTMPHMTGLQLARKIKNIRPEMPIILSTGFSTSVTPERLSAAGIDLLLDKPASVQKLSDAIYKLLN